MPHGPSKPSSFTPVPMSTIIPSVRPSIDRFTTTFNAASNEYQTVTGYHLGTHPFATQLGACDDPSIISEILRGQARSFNKSCKGDKNLVKVLDPTVDILFTLSSNLVEGVGLVRRFILSYDNPPTQRSQSFSPAKEIFTAIKVLLGVSKFLPELLVPYFWDIRTLGREGFYGEPQDGHPSLRAYSRLPPAFEKSHSDPTDRRIDGATRQDHGSTTFRSRTVDKGGGGQGN